MPKIYLRNPGLCQNYLKAIQMNTNFIKPKVIHRLRKQNIKSPFARSEKCKKINRTYFTIAETALNGSIRHYLRYLNHRPILDT